MAKFGFASIQDGRTNTGKLNFAFKALLGEGSKIFYGRVVSIILDDSHPRYQELGGPRAVGIVEFVDYKDNPRDTETTNGGPFLKYAKPLFLNQKNIPTLNELILIIPGPSPDIQQNTSKTTLYYLNSLNTWSHPHHNSIPFTAGNTNSTENQNYTTAGIVANKVLAEIPVLNLGKGFVERSDINALAPNIGDTIQEGRWGNSLRFSNNTGSAVTLLRNGQGVLTDSKFDLVREDINKDDSSLYLLSNTGTNLLPASINDYFSYRANNKPEAINKFIGNQIVLNAGRLVLNSKTDHLLLTSNKSINLNARESINLETTGEIVFATDKLYLGSQNATEPILLGDVAVNLLTDLSNILERLLKSASIAANSGGPVEPLASDSKILLGQLKVLKGQFENMKSTRNFTI